MWSIWKDIRDWIAFALAAAAPAFFIWHGIGADLAKSPQSVQMAVYLLLVTTVAMAAGVVASVRHSRREIESAHRTAESQIQSERDKTQSAIQSAERLKADLGLSEIRVRELSTPIHTLYQGVERSYRWHGLSAVNEIVGQTQVWAAISSKAQAGAEFKFTLTDEQDWLRIEEQARWENADNVRHEGLVQNILGSKEKLAGFASKYAKIRLLSASRIPLFRIVEIDDERIDVGHYDKDGCGFRGTYIVLKKSHDDPSLLEKGSGGFLYEWFRRAADLDRKNAVVDELYNHITGLMLQNASDEEIVDKVLHNFSFDTLRRLFNEHFDWWLDENNLSEAVKYLRHRYGVTT